MKLEDAAKHRNESRSMKRRYTLRDMAIIKLDTANANGAAKRGKPLSANQRWVVCGCGREGCFISASPMQQSRKGSHLKRPDLARFTGDQMPYEVDARRSISRYPRGAAERTYPSDANVQADLNRS
jgi:hypothetical protein